MSQKAVSPVCQPGRADGRILTAAPQRRVGVAGGTAAVPGGLSGSAYFLGRFAPSILLTLLSICRTRLCRFPVGTRRRRALYCGRQRSLQCLAGAGMCGHGILQFFAITSGFQLVLYQWNMRM